MSSPCHIELVLTEKGSDVKNEAVSDAMLTIATHDNAFAMYLANLHGHCAVCCSGLCA